LALDKHVTNNLVNSLESYVESTGNPLPGGGSEAHNFLQMRLAIRSRGRIHLLNSAEIDWIEAADNYVNIHSGANEYLMRESMKDIEARLGEGRFLRVHRCVIVNMDRVQEVRVAPHGDSSWSIVLRDGTALPLSRSRRDKIEQIIVEHQQAVS
jgi:two-component system, LytTR family, response regulator